MLVQHIQRGHGHVNVGIERSMWLSSPEYGISSRKYVIVEF